MPHPDKPDSFIYQLAHANPCAEPYGHTGCHRSAEVELSRTALSSEIIRFQW